MQISNFDLEDLRKVNKKSQEEVAEALNVSLSSYRNKENGKNELWFHEAHALTRLYKCEYEDILNAMQLTAKKNKKKKK